MTTPGDNHASPTAKELADQSFDVVVVGSGAAGMSAAITAAARGLTVVIVEKSPYWGGSTSRSGGGVWIPGNTVLQRDAPPDDLEAARQYVHSIVGPAVDPERIDTYINRGPEALQFLIDHSPLKLEWVKNYSDYYPEAPGGLATGRSCEPVPFDARALGDDLDTLHPPYSKTPLNVVVKQSDYRWLSTGFRTWRGPVRMVRVGLRSVVAKVRRQHLIGMGAALMAELLLGVRKAGIPLQLNTELTDLVTENGRVVGVVVTSNEQTMTLRATHGVVLACGGFDNNAEMRRKYQREPIGSDWTTGAPTNTGDGINAALKLGAGVSFMNDAWWGPSIPLPKGPWFALAERSLPRSIMVNDRGERFMNESLPYVEAVHRMYGGEFGQGDGPGENIPAWLIFDQTYRDRYLFASVTARAPLPRKWLESGAIVKASTLEGLAEKIGVPVDRFTATVERFNRFARLGVDEDFHRGESKYDHYYGDISNKPNPSLGELTKGPFYAAKMVPGDLGTKGGINTDTAGRALREDGTVIEGLYAAGNTSAPVMGHTYAGPGATIGPALVFGYLASLDIAEKARSMAGTPGE
ncbi:3-oxosteroid 1-dehydrogenase [Rhodococcus tibetensis]|uniref:3-oxosteroid 1-dehydrogenase n=1 Tax=Rhodococcus tibetensis TaxID=2965064 RepID=A0ABT1QBG5_9NOCA|nr:3-oxosteroid 1-dehydrogenase [Rhodococcus sp. FXJ9.536]MCQ4119615.1 3-oxosteroid 1-dehydrogenase [Rhodococcus sp. FXJ9.536]